MKVSEIADDTRAYSGPEEIEDIDVTARWKSITELKRSFVVRGRAFQVAGFFDNATEICQGCGLGEGVESYRHVSILGQALLMFGQIFFRHLRLLFWRPIIFTQRLLPERAAGLSDSQSLLVVIARFNEVPYVMGIHSPQGAQGVLQFAFRQVLG